MTSSKFWRLAFAVLAAFSFASCSSDDDEDETVSYVEVFYTLKTSEALRDRVELTYEWFDDYGERKQILIQQPGIIAVHNNVTFHRLPAQWGFKITPKLKESEGATVDGPLTFEAVMWPTVYYKSGRHEALLETKSSFSAESDFEGWYTLLQSECRQTGLVQSVNKKGIRSQDASYVW